MKQTTVGDVVNAHRQEIESLRQQLAEKDAEIERLGTRVIEAEKIVTAAKTEIKQLDKLRELQFNDLNNQLAVMQIENESLRKANKECVEYFAESQKDLAASRAREHLLIHALENHNGNYKLTKAECAEIRDVIRQSEKQDTAALETMIAKAKSEQSDFDNQQFMEERKRLITAAGEAMRKKAVHEANHFLRTDGLYIANAIRAIPGITLEDLQK